MNQENKREDIQSQALKIAIENKKCGLGISMGVGKTRVAIQHLQHNYNPLIEVLVVIPKNSIAQSWLDELDKMGLKELANHITFTTYISLKKHNPNNYDIVYLDECHSLLRNHEIFLSQFNGKILGLTGTPPENFDKAMMVKKYCPIKFNFTVDEATDSKILNNYQIIVHELELSKLKTLKKTKKNGGFWWTSEFIDYDYTTKRCEDATTPKQKQWAALMRMRSIMTYSTKEDYVKSLTSALKSKCIIFANTQKQADKLCEYSYHTGNPKSKKNLELFTDGQINKLSCVLQLSEGVTIPNLKQGVIMHAYGNEKTSSQRIGRLLRLDPNDTSTCHILCYKNTQDQVWVKNALKDFDSSKIKYYNPLKS
jgi:superfamily II DNA or RNA helicase